MGTLLKKGLDRLLFMSREIVHDHVDLSTARLARDDVRQELHEGGTRVPRHGLANDFSRTGVERRVQGDRDRLQRELMNLSEAIALGTITNAEAAAAVQPRRDDLARIEAQLRRPRVVPPDIAKVRAALKLRAAEWKADLRAEPHVARLVLRRLVGPLTLWDESKRPDFVKWEAQPTTGLVDGLAPTLEGSSPTGFEEGREWKPATLLVGIAA